MQPFGRVTPDYPPAPRDEQPRPAAPIADRRRIHILRKPVAPACGQRHGARLEPVKHPDQRDIGQRARWRIGAHLPADIGVIAFEPDLFDMPLPSGRAGPQDRRIGLAPFIAGQRVKAVPHMRGQFRRMEIVLFLPPAP